MPWQKRFDQAKVLDLAMRAFWMHGYEATSMQQIVDETGVNRGSLYATYGDKRALFIASLHSYIDRRDRLLAELAGTESASEAIRRAFTRLFPRDRDTGGSPGCFLVNTALELAAHDVEIRGVVTRALHTMEKFFAERVAAGRAGGEFRRSVDADKAGAALLATLLGTRVLIRSRPDRAQLQSIVDAALAQLT